MLSHNKKIIMLSTLIFVFHCFLGLQGSVDATQEDRCQGVVDTEQLPLLKLLELAKQHPVGYIQGLDEKSNQLLKSAYDRYMQEMADNNDNGNRRLNVLGNYVAMVNVIIVSNGGVVKNKSHSNISYTADDDVLSYIYAPFINTYNGFYVSPNSETALKGVAGIGAYAFIFWFLSKVFGKGFSAGTSARKNKGFGGMGGADRASSSSTGSTSSRSAHDGPSVSSSSTSYDRFTRKTECDEGKNRQKRDDLREEEIRRSEAEKRNRESFWGEKINYEEQERQRRQKEREKKLKDDLKKMEEERQRQNDRFSSAWWDNIFEDREPFARSRAESAGFNFNYSTGFGASSGFNGSSSRTKFNTDGASRSEANYNTRKQEYRQSSEPRFNAYASGSRFNADASGARYKGSSGTKPDARKAPMSNGQQNAWKESHYAKLEISQDLGKKATQDDIKKAYHTKALKCHPDKGGSQKEFQEVGNAYEILKDPAKRALYDMTVNF